MHRRLIVFLFVFSVSASAQTEPRKFEVASVKVHEGPLYSMGAATKGMRITETDTVLGLLMFAYNIKNFQVPHAATELQAVGDTFYDVVAKAEGDAIPTRDEFRSMMQLLLAERFHLKLHREPQEIPVYDLVVGRNGLKLKESAPDATPHSLNGPRNPTDRNYQLSMTKASIPELIDAMQGAFPARPVRDKTGLTGTYDVKLIYTPDFRFNKGDPEPDDITIFAAVQDQLGLKVEQTKAMVDIYAIDHVEKPSGN
jgi:uncharacterized protein (TIGR03435 family)